MATNHTENYALNLWEPTDAFVREEFNENTNKIEAAFLNHPSAELLCTLTADAETGKHFYLDISQVDWSRYIALVLVVKISTVDHLDISFRSGIERCSNIFTQNDNVSHNDSACRLCYTTHSTVFFPVLYSGDRSPTALGFGSGADRSDSNHNGGQLSGGGGELPLNQCSQLSISRQLHDYESGDKAELWGIK